MRIFKAILVSFVFGTAVLFAAVKGPEIGKKAPDFILQDMNGKTVSLSQFARRFVVLEWLNHGCPFIKKHYDSGNMQGLQDSWTKKGVIWLSVCSSAKGKQGYMKPEEWVKISREKNSKATAVLLDPSGKAGKTFRAKTTPHMFIIDPKGNLIYKGALDSFSNFDEDVTKLNNHVNNALNEAMAGKKVTLAETEPYGCSVKY